MEVSDLFYYLRNRSVRKQVDFAGDLQAGLERVLMENIGEPKIHFTRSYDQRIDALNARESYLGESLMDVITHIENNYPIHICANPNEEDGYDFSVEWKE